jgi:hypothetical protein
VITPPRESFDIRVDHIELFLVVIKTKQNHYCSLVMSIFRTRMETHRSTSQLQAYDGHVPSDCRKVAPC